MPETYNLYNLEAPFEEYLVAGNQKAVSVKNYLSDFRHFAGWVILYFKSNQPTVRTIHELSLQITSKTISEYKSYLESNNIPHKTINRRLSTIRKFCSFCISQGWMKENPAKKIGNIRHPQGVLESVKASVSPIPQLSSPWRRGSSLDSLLRGNDKKRNDDKQRPNENQTGNFGFQQYIAFLIILIFVSVMGAGIYNQFFVKNQTSLAYPTTPTKAGRILSFQGRLTDTLSNPITTATNVVFQLYSVSSGGVALYNTGTCSVTPDQDGIFSSLIGSDCGAEIAASVFTENPNVYLGITVGGDAEMTPRQQIANVGYAINSETLQGLPPGTGTSVIPYINVDGNLLISASSPGIRSTSASTDFTLSSAKATVIQSAGTGDVILQATESGSLIFRTGGATGANTRITVDNLGNVGIGTTAPANKLDVAGTAQMTGFKMTTSPSAGYILTSDAAGVGSWADVSSTAGPWTLSGVNLYPDSTAYNVGIGTTAPGDYKLNVNGNSNLTGTLNVTTSVSSPIFQGIGAAVTFGNASYGTTIAGSGLTVTPTAWTATPTISGLVTMTSGFDSNAASTVTALTVDGAGGAGDLTVNAGETSFTSPSTTANANIFYGNSLTSGNLLSLSSTSTALTTGSLASFDWSPGSSTTATGDLLSLNIGTNGNIGNLFNVKDTGSSLFSVSETAVTSNLPTSFTSSGDVSIAYDLNFTNPTASYIKSSAPLYIQAGETFGSSDLTLQTYNSGDLVIDSPGGVTLAQAQAWDLADSSTTSLNIESGLLNFDTTNSRVGIGTTNPTQVLDVTGSAGISGSLVIDNIVTRTTDLSLNSNSTSRALLFKIDSAEKMRVDTTGNVGIGTTAPANKLDVAGTAQMTGFKMTTSPSAGYILTSDAAGVGSWADVSSTAGPWTLSGVNLYPDSTSYNVGIGTTAPLAKLHVEGQCVAMGTLIRRRRRKKNGEWEEEDVPVEDIEPGDEVLTLNEETGEFEWQMVEKTMDMGMQTSYQLTTESGKKIETTINHPYLVKNQKTAQRADLVSPTSSTYDWLDNLKSSLQQTNNFVKSIFGVDPPGVEPGRLGLSSQSSEPAEPTQGSLSQKKVKNSTWTKVVYLKIGDEIATLDGFEKIVSIKKRNRKQMYDLQIANTHNFVGNGIVAHNTYLNGNVGIGTTSPQSALTLGGSGSIASGLTFGTANTGFYVPSATGLLYFVQGGTIVGQFYTDGFGGYVADGPKIRNVAASSTVPNILPVYNDPDTGIGRAGADILSLIAGGTNGLNVNSSGNVGIGTTSPDKKLSVWGGDGSIWDPTDLGTESLTNGALTAGTSWTQTTDCALVTDAATCTFAAGTASTVQQASGTLAVAGVGSRWYKFVYTVSGITGTPAASITTAFASTSTALTLTAGTQTTYFKSATTPTNFVITTTLTAGQAFTLDTFSLKEVQGGDLALGGILTGGGTTGLKVLANGNVGIGTTSPGMLLDIDDNSAGGSGLRVTGGGAGGNMATFTRDVGSTGTIGINSNGGWPQISFASASNTFSLGTYSTSFTISDNTAIGTNDRLTIDSTGNVGIGTTAPANKLDVAGTAQMMGFKMTTSPSAGYVLTSDATGVGSWADVSSTAGPWTLSGVNLYPDSTSYNVGIGTTSPLSKLGVLGNLSVGATYGAVAAPTSGAIFEGNVGIGITSPGERLHVTGGSIMVGDQAASLPAIKYVNAGYDVYTYGNNGLFMVDDSNFSTTPTLTVDVVNGNVGIGTTAPANKLDVAGTAQMTGFKMTTSPATGYILTSDATGVGSWADVSSTAGPWTLAGVNLYPDSTSYNVGIGTTSPGAGTKLAVIGGNVGIGTTGPGANLDVLGTGTEAAPSTLRVNSPNSTTAGDARLVLAQGGATDMQILYTGTDSRTDGRNANDLYIEQGQRMNLRTKGNGSTYNIGLTLGTSTMNFYTNAVSSSPVERLRISATGGLSIGSTYVGTDPGDSNLIIAGNVGIGTTAPANKLDVAGTAQMTGIKMTTSPSSGYVLTSDATGVGSWADVSSTAGPWTLSGSNLYPDSTAYNVGIGTTAPGAYKLNVNGNSNVTGTLNVTTSVSSPTFQGIGAAVTFGNASYGTTIAGSGLTVSPTAWTATPTISGLVTMTSGFDSNTASTVTALTIDGTAGTGDLTINSGETSFTSPSTTANANIFYGNSLTSGNLLYLSSTSTALTTGSLASLDWSPGSALTATGDLLSLNIGANGNIGNLFNVKDTGSSLFSVSETAVTSNLPTSFTSSGDVSIAYDLNFTNPTASYIKSSAPLYIQAGETFNSSDLNLKTYNSGDLVMDAGGSTTGTGTVKFYDSNVKGATDTTPIGFAGASSDINTFRTNFTSETVIGSINEAYSAAVGGAGGLWLDGGTYAYPNTTYVTDVMVPSGNVGIGATSAGTAKLYVNGNVGIGTTSPANKLDVNGSITISNTVDTNGNLRFSAANPYIYASSYFVAPGGAYFNSGTVYTEAQIQARGGIADDGGVLELNDDVNIGAGDLYVVNSSGNVGIGTTAPGALLDVSTAASSNPTFQLSDGDVAHGMTSLLPTTSLFRIQNYGSSQGGAWIIGASDLGTTPGTTLQGVIGVSDPTDTVTALLLNGSKSNGTTGYQAMGALETVFQVETGAVGSGTKLLTILGNGNVGIGTTAPLTTLDVKAANSASPHIRMSNIGSDNSGIYAYSATPTHIYSITRQSSIATADVSFSTYGGLGIATGATGGQSTAYKMYITNAGNVGIGTTGPGYKLNVYEGLIALNNNGWNHILADAETESLVPNGDFEQGSYGWNNVSSIVTGTSNSYSGNNAARFNGPLYLESQDYIPVDPVRDVLDLEAYVKKLVAGTTPGILYFGYYAYDANKTIITTAPCGTYCYFATAGWTIPVDGNWHKVSATTTGEGTSYPNFPVGTRYIRILGLINYSASGDAVTLVDHIRLKRINYGPLFVGNNFSSTNMTDQYQVSKVYTTSGNALYLEPPTTGNVILNTTGNVGISTTSPLAIDGGASTKLHIDNGTGTGNIEVARFEGGSDADNTYGVVRIGHANDRGLFLKGGRQTGDVAIATLGLTDSAGTMSDVMTFLNGNVGIGTTSPSSMLSVGSTSQFQVNSSGAIAAATGVISSGNIDLSSLSAGGLVKAAVTTGRLSIASAGSDYENILTFSNGITRTVNDVKLGGTLTAATEIPLGGYNFSFSGTGNVGIGTTAPGANKLNISGGDVYMSNDLRAAKFTDITGSDAYYLDSANGGSSLVIAGNILSKSSTPYITGFDGVNYNSLILVGSNTSGATSVCVSYNSEGSSCSGKIDAGTVDPPYTINGKNYATFLSAMTGVKEETTGIVTTAQLPMINNQSSNIYGYTIDFSNQPEASDLWLFSKTTNLTENIDKMSVLLTPSDSAKVWYNVDKENYRLIIYSSRPTNISYRLTAPRFDSEGWSNRRADDARIGFVINDQGDVSNSSSSLSYKKPEISNNDFVYDGNIENFKQSNSLFTLTGDFVDEFTSVTEALIARLKAGFIEAENIIVNNTLIAKNAILETAAFKIINSEKIRSPIVETTDITATGTATLNTIATNEIKPQSGDLTIDLSSSVIPAEAGIQTFLDPLLQGDDNGVEKGTLARLIIKGLEGKTVTTIDSAGNASFSGQIIADSLTINNDATVSGNFASNTLTVNDASISGKLIAREIESDNLNSLTRELVNSQTNINDIQKLLADIKNQPIPNLTNETNLTGVSNLNNVRAIHESPLQDLIVTGQSNLYNVSVSNSLLVGTTLIDQNSIISLASELKLSALAKINLFDGAVIIAKDGKITTRGEIIAEGGIRTDEIKALTDEGQVSIKNLTINNLTIDKISTNSAIIAAADNFDINGIFAPAIEAATASAGLGILPANQSEVIIYNDRVNADSLIYLTPTSSTDVINHVSTGDLAVGQKQDCIEQSNNETMKQCKKYFKVVTNTQSTLPVKFNWLIIN